MKELAKIEATNLHQKITENEEDKEQKTVLFSHREDGDLGYLQALNTAFRAPSPSSPLFSSSVNLDDWIIVLTSGGEGVGQFLISGQLSKITQKKKEIEGLLEGKGGGKGLIQGKAGTFKNVPALLELLSGE